MIFPVLNMLTPTQPTATAATIAPALSAPDLMADTLSLEAGGFAAIVAQIAPPKVVGLAEEAPPASEALPDAVPEAGEEAEGFGADWLHAVLEVLPQAMSQDVAAPPPADLPDLTAGFDFAAQSLVPIADGFGGEDGHESQPDTAPKDEPALQVLPKQTAPAAEAHVDAPEGPRGLTMAPTSPEPMQASHRAAGQEPVSGLDVRGVEPVQPEVLAAETHAPDMRAADPRSAELRSREVDATPDRPPLLRNVLDRLEEIEQSEGRTRILLRPQGLGVLEVEVTRLADGRLQMAIRAENPLILQSLQQDTQGISDFLGARGFDLAGGGPDLGRYARPQAQGGAAGGSGDVETEAEEPAQTPTSIGQGQVDIVT